jgi:hypothetical protein
MARYTKQIRKRRQRTKKLKNARRTKRYKIKYGGLGPHDQENIGITDRWSFQDGHTEGVSAEDTDGRSKADKIREFEIYIFGSREHAELWKQIMTACISKDIIFYILTSGNKVSIIRTLQLLELDHLVREVLCVNNDVVSNPNNRKDATRNNFRRKMKYDVIHSIMEGRYGPTNSAVRKVTGAFIDDDRHNGEPQHYCPPIEFIHATGSVDPTLNTDNPYRTMCQQITPDISRKIYKTPNIIGLELLTTLLDKINTSSYQSCVFSDFDRTLSANDGTLPFYNEKFKTVFFKRFNVTVTPIQPSE